MLRKLPEDSLNFSLNPDSKHVAYITDSWHTVALWNLQENKADRIFAHEDEIQFYDVAFSPDGKLIALLTSTGKLMIWNWETEQVIKTLEAADDSSLSWSPDGSRIVVCGYHNNSYCDLIDPSTKKGYCG
jgi:WD40 repeat protein